MALRIYNGICASRSCRQSKGRKKKKRRMDRAESRDGWARKKSNGLAPALRTSKRDLHYDLASWGI